MPVPEALALCDRVRGEGGRYREAYANTFAGYFHRMAGDWEKGTELIDGGRNLLYELGQDVSAASTRMATARAGFFIGQLEEAESELRLAYDELDRMGERGYLSTVVALLAGVLSVQRRYEEAEEMVQRARELGAEDDLTTELYWRTAQAEILAGRGEFENAFTLLDEAHELMDATDYLTDRAAALMTRASVEKAAGNREGARVALEDAVALFERKGDLTAAKYGREQLAAV
jgi:tetratricopeptide (TPR) repeat protein